MQIVTSTLVIKSSDDEGVIYGIASTPSLDVVGDTVDPMGANFELPIMLLDEHKGNIIGIVEEATPTPDGIQVKARVAKDASPKCRQLWQDIKSGVKAAFSIGFVPLESKSNGKGQHYSKWVWQELSIVGNPANTDAVIQVVKHSTNLTENGQNMNIQQQIAAKQAEKAALAQANEALVVKAVMTDEDQTSYDKNKTELDRIDKHLQMLQETEAAMVKSAVTIDPATVNNANAGSQARAGIVTVKSNLPKGTAFVRYATALARSKGNLMQAAEIAKSYKDTPEVETIIKAAVQVGTTTDPTWAAPLVDYTTMTSEFMELLRPQTILGKIDGFRRVPTNIKIQGQTSGATVGWVGQGKLKPVSSLAFETTTLGEAKLSGIIPITEELARNSSPSAEALISNDLRESIAQFLDDAFINEAHAATAVSPASITNGITAITPTGTDVAAVKKDVQTVFEQFINANLDPSGAVWVMSPVRALALSLMTLAQDNPAFPTINMNGGTFFGLPVVVSLTAGDNIVLFKASEILLADEGVITLDSSSEASLLMSDDPENDKATMSMVSLWQAGMIGFKADRFINWKVRRKEAIALIKDAAYTA